MAPVTEPVVESLRAKHPAGPPTPFGSTAGPRNGEIPSEDILLAAFKSFKPDTAPGISGWTHHLLAVALRSPVVLKALHTLTGLIAAGTAPGQSMLCSSRLTALLKPDGGYRPIAVGELVYRLCTKAILRHSFRPDFLLPFQFGVGTKGGVEPVIRAAQRALDDSLDQSFIHLTSLDFSNAFNTVDRREIASGLRRFAPSLYRAGRWAYGTPSDLVLVSRETGTTYNLSSAQGVRQGDPLGPLMFSLGIRALLNDLSTSLGPHRLILAYLDDIYILSNDPNALEDVQAFFSARQPSIQLNMAKSKTTTLQEARETGLQLLGSCIGPTAARERFLEAKIVAEEALLAKLVDLPHQHALLVLRQCLQQNLRHLQRSLRSDDLKHLWERLDKSLANSVRRIRAAGSPAPSQAIDDTLIALPIKLGGLGILSFKTCAPLAFAAASEASDTLLAPLLDQDTDTTNQTVLSQRERCQEAFLAARDSLLESLDPRSAKSLIEASSLLGRKWLSVIPFSAALRLSDFDVSAALHARTLLPGAATHCRHCGAPNQLGHDEICLRRAPWTMARHEQAKRTIGMALATVEGVQVHLEPMITGTQRRNDIRITGSASSGLSSEDIDITIVSLASQESQTATLPPAATEDDSAAERTTKLVQKHLNA